MSVEQTLSSGLIVRQDIGDAVRPVFFQTDYEEFLYATHGGTLFVVKYCGRAYALTCNHVFKDFPTGRLFVVDKKHAESGSLPARIEGIRFASNPRGAAIDTDIGDICLIEFSSENPTEFFGDSPYIIDEKTVATAAIDHDLLVYGVLKEKTRVTSPELEIGYCKLEFKDAGPHPNDPTLRRAYAVFDRPEFESVTGISGSPVFDSTANALCGMAVRGGMNGHRCDILYVDIFDIVKLIEAVSDRAECTYYAKTLAFPARLTS
jgi:hypothetical protein